jgi:hypothetical protein
MPGFGFADVDPWETRVCRAERLQVGAAKGMPNNELRSAIKTGHRKQDEYLLDEALRLMQRTVELVFKEESLIACAIEIDQSGLIALIEACEDPLKPKAVVAVLSKIVSKLLPVITKGRLKKTFPNAQPGRKNPSMLLFRRCEIESVLADEYKQDPPPQPTAKEGVNLIEALPPIHRNHPGICLAQSLVDRVPAEAKKILFKKLVQIITPQLSWNKDPERVAQKVSHRLLEGLRPNAPLPNDDFTNCCCILYNLNVLYRRVADIVQKMHAEKQSQRADVLDVLDVLTLKDAGAPARTSLSVSFGGRDEEVDTLKWWSGLRGKPRKEDRVEVPIMTCLQPTWIGVVFSPGQTCTLQSFSVFVALGAGGEKKEHKYIIPGVPEEWPPDNSLGLSFCCKILEWDQVKNCPGLVLWESEETYIDDTHFRKVDFNLQDCGLRVESYQEVLITLTSEHCTSRRKGPFMWVSGVGKESCTGKQIPHEIRKGVFALSGRRSLKIGGKGKTILNPNWEQREDVMACRIVYRP